MAGSTPADDSPADSPAVASSAVDEDLVMEDAETPEVEVEEEEEEEEDGTQDGEGDEYEIEEEDGEEDEEGEETYELVEEGTEAGDGTVDYEYELQEGDGEVEVEGEGEPEAFHDGEGEGEAEEDEDDDEVLLLRVPEERELSPEDDDEAPALARTGSRRSAVERESRAQSEQVTPAQEPMDVTAEDAKAETVPAKPAAEPETAPSSAPTPTPSTSAAPPRKSHKRKLDENASPRETPPPRVDSSSVALPPLFQPAPAYFAPGFFTTRSHPWNKSGYRYIACGPFEDAPPTTYPIYRTIETSPPGCVKWAWEDRSSYVHISKDGLSVTAEKGFRSARANIPIREGKWYFEIKVERGGGEKAPAAGGKTEASHVRIGVGRRESGLNAPAGIDGFSYGFRDKTGDTVHLSKPQRYGSPFGSGDVIGVYVDLPTMRSPVPGDTKDPARIVRKRIPIRYRGQLYFESTELVVSKEMEDLAEAASPTKLKAKPAAPSKKAAPGQKVAPPKPAGPPPRPLIKLEGSKVAFFKNGESQGVAFRDLLDFVPLRAHPKPKNAPRRNADELGTMARENTHDDATIGYFPFVSVYGGAVVRLNAGPDFAFPPPKDIDAALGEPAPAIVNGDEAQAPHLPWRPLSEFYPIYMADQRRLDLIDAEEARRAYAREEAAMHQEMSAQDRKKAKQAARNDRQAAKAVAAAAADAAAAAAMSVTTPLKPSPLVNASGPLEALKKDGASRTGTPLSHEWKPEQEVSEANGSSATGGATKANGGPYSSFMFLPAETEVVILEDDGRTLSRPGSSGGVSSAAAVEALAVAAAADVAAVSAVDSVKAEPISEETVNLKVNGNGPAVGISAEAPSHDSPAAEGDEDVKMELA